MTDQKEGAPVNLGGRTDAPDAAEAPGASITMDSEPGKMPLGQQPTALVMRRAANFILDLPPAILETLPGGADAAAVDLVSELRARALLMDLEIIRNADRRGRMADVVRHLLTRLGVVIP